MVDLDGKDKGNISLPQRLQPPDIEEDDYLLGEEHKVTILNMQKTMYEIKIADLEKRIQRLEDRNIFILDECSTTDLEIKSKDTETAEEIAELNREISRETRKVEADNEKIENIQQLRLQNKEEHESNMKSLQKRYEMTRLSLVSKIKILNAKINTLEDFKTMKETFEHKLKDRDQVMKECEEKIKWALEQIDRKFKIAREKMKNDLYQQLLNLASDFQVEISDGLSFPIHRLIRENIVIQNELVKFFNENLLKHEKTSELGYSTEMHRGQIEESQRQTVHEIITSKIQALLVSALKNSHSKIKKRLTAAKTASQHSRKHHGLMEELEMQNSKLDFRRRQLEVNLHQIQTRVNSALNKKSLYRYMIKKLKQVLYDVKFAASCALKILDFDEEIEKMSYNQLLLHLLNKIIMENKSEAWIKPAESTETIFPTDVAFRFGDLGFDPPRLELQITSPKIIIEPPSPPGRLEFLKQFAVTVEPPTQVDDEEKSIFIQSSTHLGSFDHSKITSSDEDENEEIESVKETKDKAVFENKIEIEIDIEKENQEF